MTTPLKRLWDGPTGGLVNNVLATRMHCLASGLSRIHARIIDVSAGRLGSSLFGVPVLVLDHVGRKSGKRRSAPLLYVRSGDDFVVVAANGGSPTHPQWWCNVQAAGHATVAVSGRQYLVKPRVAEGGERANLWRELVDVYPQFAIYTTYTDRTMPVVVLERSNVDIS
jgi:deazaflavin-dependent oxidoreductase (nitroreductase family)